MPDASLIFQMLSQLLQQPVIEIGAVVGGLFIVLFVLFSILDMLRTSVRFTK